MANNPGSEEAVKKGCLCPIMDNRRGLGSGNFKDKQSFWVVGVCPLHGNPKYRKETNE